MSKFNAKKVEVDGIKFDSEVESKYYVHLLKLKREGIVKDFTNQPAFVLQEGFEKHGKQHKPIKYKADFEIWYSDGSHVVVDVKGMKTPEFSLKEKLYAKQYDVELICISYSKIDGGWIEYDALQEARKARKKEKEKREKAIVKDMQTHKIFTLPAVEAIKTAMTKYKITKTVAIRLLKEAKKPAKGTK